VRLTATFLAGHGATSARLDAELLIAHALGLRRIDLYLGYDRPLAEAQLAAIREPVRRRAAGEPVAYITGVREFYSRAFEVGPDVLVPRPETETLVQAVLDRVPAGAGCVMADLGTGSGCIAVTLAAERPRTTVVATDTSPAALAVAARNATRHGVEGRVALAQGEWAGALTAGVDVVVSNPPYLTTAELDDAPRDVRCFEPRGALDAGVDGLDAYRALLSSLPAKLRRPAVLALEVDPRRADDVLLLVTTTFPGAATAKLEDLAHDDRVVVAEIAGDPAV